ncbi:MAG: hypothetical protein AAF288_11465 [Planctomycetota bacterium]
MTPETSIYRSISIPIREMSIQQRWRGPDQGLVWCWERGRAKSQEEPELAAKAQAGELPVLAWIGGVEKALKMESKPGTLYYLATWQGLRGDDLSIDLENELEIVCSRTGQSVAFGPAKPATL